MGEGVHLTDKDIWITFDNQITDYTLGMDLLNEIAFMYNPKCDQLMHFNTYEELQNTFIVSGYKVKGTVM